MSKWDCALSGNDIKQLYQMEERQQGADELIKEMKNWIEGRAKTVRCGIMGCVACLETRKLIAKADAYLEEKKNDGE
jgi:hypothetical protein